jgi:hypothetical protein
MSNKVGVISRNFNAGTIKLSFYDASPFLLGAKLPKIAEYDLSNVLPTDSQCRYALTYRGNFLFIKASLQKFSPFSGFERYYKVGIENGQVQLVLDLPQEYYATTMGYGIRPGGTAIEYVVLSSLNDPVTFERSYNAFVSVDGSSFTYDASYPVARFTEVAQNGDPEVSNATARYPFDGKIEEPPGLVSGALGVEYNRDIYIAYYGGGFPT